MKKTKPQPSTRANIRKAIHSTSILFVTLLCLTVARVRVAHAQRAVSLFSSTDNGLTWIASDSGLTPKLFRVYDWDRSRFWIKDDPRSTNPHVLALATQGDVIYAGTGDGVFRSTNHGSNWERAGLDSTEVTALAVADTFVLAGTFNNGVFCSTNRGGSWCPADSGLPRDANVACLKVLGRNSFVSAGGGLYFSTDQGKQWGYGQLAGSIKSIAFFDKNIYALNNYGIFVSTDYHWDEEPSGFWESLKKMFTRPTDYLTWTPIARNPEAEVLCIQDSNIFACCNYGKGILRSSDKGTSWIAVNNGLRDLRSLCINAVAVSGNYLLVGTDEGIFVSSDQGQNWVQPLHNLKNIEVHCLAVNSSGRVYAGGYSPRTYFQGISDLNEKQNTDEIATPKIVPSVSWNGVAQSIQNTVMSVINSKSTDFFSRLWRDAGVTDMHVNFEYQPGNKPHLNLSLTLKSLGALAYGQGGRLIWYPISVNSALDAIWNAGLVANYRSSLAGDYLSEAMRNVSVSLKAKQDSSYTVSLWVSAYSRYMQSPGFKFAEEIEIKHVELVKARRKTTSKTGTGLIQAVYDPEHGFVLPNETDFSGKKNVALQKLIDLIKAGQ